MAKKEAKKKVKVEEKARNRGMILIPYVKGLSERIEWVMKKRRISTAMQPHTTLRNLLVHPKDKAEPKGVYKIKCQGCEGCYVGDTKRKLAVRVKEHRADVDNRVLRDRVFTQEKRNQSETERNKFAITDHVCQTNHLIDWDNARMVERESDWTDRCIKEAIVIR